MGLKPLHKLLILTGLACLGLIIYYVLDSYHIISQFQDGKLIRQFIESNNTFGPIIVILLMTAAIMVSPLPSAPIAIAAGAVYGHTWGTIYVLIGSISGASSAFLIARYLGYEYIQSIAKNYLPSRSLNSQWLLMGFVLISRLLPFLSFDVISYAAGLTVLVYWRFLIATLVGIIPASFFLAHVGSEMASTEIDRIVVALLLFTLLTGLALLFRMIRNGTLKNK